MVREVPVWGDNWDGVGSSGVEISDGVIILEPYGGIAVDATLNGETATMIFYEDQSGDGEADATLEVQLQDGQNNYPTNNLELVSGNEIWWELQSTDDGDITDAAQINAVEISY